MVVEKGKERGGRGKKNKGRRGGERRGRRGGEGERRGRRRISEVRWNQWQQAGSILRSEEKKFSKMVRL